MQLRSPRILINTSTNRVQSKTAPAFNETMEAHPAVSRTLELLAAEMNVYPERMLPVDARLVARLISLVDQIDVDLNTPLFAEDE
jgi:antitoxin PrlF